MKAGWQTKTLEEVCEVEYGTRVVQKRDGGSLYSVYGGGGATFHMDTYNREERLVIARFGMSEDCMRFVSGKFFLNDSGLTLSPKSKGLIQRFVDYKMLSMSSKIYDLGRGTAQKNLDVPAFRNISFSFPKDTNEQQRIVTILDEAFEGIATATANAKKNLQYSREIYESVLEGVFASSTDSSETIELGEIIVTLTDYHANGSYEILKQNVELKDTEDYAWMVRSTDFENSFEKDMRYISKSAYEYLKKSQVFGGEIIMSKIGNAGKVYLMPEINRPCSLAMNLFLIRLNNNKASNKYIYRFLKSKRGEIQIKSRLKGAATQTITKDNVRTLRIPLLPRINQDLLESRLESLEAETEKLEAIYQQKLTALDELKKSILNQAFSGQLN